MLHLQIKQFLRNREWVTVHTQNPKFERYAPPAYLGLPDDFSLDIPANNEAIDYEMYTNNLVSVIADIYLMDKHHLFSIIKEGQLE